ncbi:prepilin-type N-terminal cleavage/methylation domain-containing protein [Candidatus Formimonas warabiya]|uniref:Prepilin-type N-terminal cleavage/methylation domain-containing protein n=1 Tax=Formimonas warabiya TaxID=1761012 RepID=A0A3G1KX02_FORW1|nr:prepilin-type N-terminal cleavage/methylation domain-containing protein [Candidatus Formimonas warabiya]ATW26735.1 hypothetical protein DCMF_19975 [Candidatus Formimonas warabiya]
MNDKGFTLIEVVVATVLLVIVLVPVFSLVTQSYIHVRMADDYNKAAFYMQERAEEIKVAEFDSIEDEPDKSFGQYVLREDITDQEEDDETGDVLIKKVVLSMKKDGRNLGQYQFYVYRGGY